jgi:hypothetical protein
MKLRFRIRTAPDFCEVKQETIDGWALVTGVKGKTTWNGWATVVII